MPTAHYSRSLPLVGFAFLSHFVAFSKASSSGSSTASASLSQNNTDVSQYFQHDQTRLQCHFDSEQNGYNCFFGLGNIQSSSVSNPDILLEHCLDDTTCVKATISIERKSKSEAESSSPPTRPPESRRSLEEDYQKATSLRDLGIQYATHGATTLEDWNGNLMQALVAFNGALDIYDKIRGVEVHSLEGGPSASVLINLADIHFQLGQIYHLDPYEQRLALDHLRLADNFFDVAIRKDRTLEEFKASWADNCIQIGKLLLTSAIDCSQNEGVQEAMEKFSQAADLHRQVIAESAYLDFLLDMDQIQTQLAAALHNKGLALSMLSRFPEAAEASEEAIELYRGIFQKRPDDETIMVAIANGHYNLSEIYLQIGKYDKAITSYHNAMDWYGTHRIEVFFPDDPPEDLEESLKKYEKALEEYQREIGDGTEVVIQENIDSGEPKLFKPDPLYEGDLHAEIGFLHLSQDEIPLALMHFVQAVELYGEAGTNDDILIGDVRLDMAMAFLRNGEFENSELQYSEALDIFRRVVGEGKNPFSDVSPCKPEPREPVKAADLPNSYGTLQLIDFESYKQSVSNVTAIQYGAL